MKPWHLALYSQIGPSFLNRDLGGADEGAEVRHGASDSAPSEQALSAREPYDSALTGGFFPIDGERLLDLETDTGFVLD